jgi:hypothetical protein
VGADFAIEIFVGRAPSHDVFTGRSIGPSREPTSAISILLLRVAFGLSA